MVALAGEGYYHEWSDTHPTPRDVCSLLAASGRPPQSRPVGTPAGVRDCFIPSGIQDLHQSCSCFSKGILVTLTQSSESTALTWPGPALLLGGQLHNSTSSDLIRAAHVMDRVCEIGANAVTATVSWHLIEPEEGSFVFDEVDALVDMARQRHLALTLLWFGAFKNAASTYAPRWVRADRERFPRAELADQEGARGAFVRPGTPVLSVFSEQLRQADQRALTALASHLNEIGAAWDDGGPLVMIQVENETGLLGAARDHAPLANRAWEAQVPAALLQWWQQHPQAHGTGARLWREHGCRDHGTWSEVLGDGPFAHETLMAWAFASYCGELSEAVRDVLKVATYVNAWVGPQPGQDEPGQYPSGGPVAGQIDVWKAAAPSLGCVGPDLYVEDMKVAISGYVRPDNPLLVPESKLSAGNVLWALGLGARGFHVFGIDDVRVDGQLALLYRLLLGASDVVSSAQRDGRVVPVLLDDDEHSTVELGGLRWTMRSAARVLGSMFLDAGVQVRTQAECAEETTQDALVPTMTDVRPMGLLIDLGHEEFLLIGQGLMVEVGSPAGEVVEIDDVEEGCYVDGRWVSGRNLNGDERLALVPLDRIAAAKIRVLRS